MTFANCGDINQGNIWTAQNVVLLNIFYAFALTQRLNTLDKVNYFDDKAKALIVQHYFHIVNDNIRGKSLLRLLIHHPVVIRTKTFIFGHISQGGTRIFRRCNSLISSEKLLQCLKMRVPPFLF